MPRNALGRGLGALIREPETQAPAVPLPPTPTPITTSGGAAAAPAFSPVQPAGPLQLDIDLIEPSPYQPRTRFREEALNELARSIRASGIIQPLVVRPIGNRYQLIAGERRWRAAQRAARGGLTVRQIERLASRRVRGAKIPSEGPLDPNIREALDELQRRLGTKVLLRQKTKMRPGQLVLEYYDEAQLTALYDRLMK